MRRGMRVLTGIVAAALAGCAGGGEGGTTSAHILGPQGGGASPAAGSIFARGAEGENGGAGGHIAISAAGALRVTSRDASIRMAVIPAHTAGSLVVAKGEVRRIAGPLACDALDVAAGGVLEVEGAAALSVAGAVRILGTVRGLPGAAPSGAALSIRLVSPGAGGVFIHGRVDLAGGAGAGLSGRGGALRVTHDPGRAAVVIITGEIDARGGPGARGGAIEIDAGAELFVSAPLRADGGPAAHGTGGAGGLIALRSAGPLTIAGCPAIDASGGRGRTILGGAGGVVGIDLFGVAADLDLDAAALRAAGGPARVQGGGGRIAVALCAAQAAALRLDARFASGGAPAGATTFSLSGTLEALTGIVTTTQLRATIAAHGGEADPPADLTGCP